MPVAKRQKIPNIQAPNAVVQVGEQQNSVKIKLLSNSNVDAQMQQQQNFIQGLSVNQQAGRLENGTSQQPKKRQKKAEKLIQQQQQQQAA